MPCCRSIRLVHRRVIINDDVAAQLAYPVTADAGDDMTAFDSDADGFASVTLDGSASASIHDSIVTYQWTWDGGSASGANPTVTLPEGVTEVTLTVIDRTSAPASDIVVVTVQPPLGSVAMVGRFCRPRRWYRRG